LFDLLVLILEELDVPYNVQWNLTLTPPSWTFLRLSVPPNQLLSMVAIQTQIDEDTWRMGLKLTRNGYPNLNTASEYFHSFVLVYSNSVQDSNEKK
jgi:hypothetical protein